MHIWFICIGGYSSFKTRVSFFPIYLGSSFWFKAKFRGVLERVLLKERRAPWRSGKRGMERNHWFELDIWGVHGSVWRIMFNCWVVNWNICGNWGRFSFWLILFSNGLKPPTRVFFHCWSLLNRCVYNFQCYVCVCILSGYPGMFYPILFAHHDWLASYLILLDLHLHTACFWDFWRIDN